MCSDVEATDKLKVAVVGAGLGGLTFAAAMRAYAPAVEVSLYERDASPTSRAQGYAIGLRNGFGLRALGDLDLRERVIGGNAVKVTDFAIVDQGGHVLLSLPSGQNGPNTTFRIQRLHLKEVLHDAAGPTPINFGRRCTGYEQHGSTVAALFEDGGRVEADYLVACDGAGSAIRHQSIGDEKRYLGLNSIHFESRLEVQHPFLAGGYFLMLGKNGSSFFCYRQPGGVYWSYVVHAESESETADPSPALLLERVRAETADWYQLVPRIVAATDTDTFGVRGYYDRDPIDHVRFGRVWLIGDAAHPMCPFQGQGANMAIIDAVGLARFFGVNPSSEGQAAALEADIVKRGRRHILDSRGNAKRFHATSSWAQAQRNFAFRVANPMIALFSKRT